MHNPPWGPQKGILFFDSGSTLTLCRHAWARKLDCKHMTVSIYLKRLGQEYERVDTAEYKIVLLDTKNETVKLYAIRLDALTQEASGGDLSMAYQQFPKIPREDLTRPEGQVDLLLGQDYAGHLPKVDQI